MIEILKTDDGALKRLDAIEPGCWVNAYGLTNAEAEWLMSELKVSEDFVEAMRDRDEVSRADKDKVTGQTLVIVDYPDAVEALSVGNPDMLDFDTQPISILIIDDPGVVVTATITPCAIIEQIKHDTDLRTVTSQRSRFLLDTLLKVSQSYIESLRVLEKQTVSLERRMRRKQNNAGLMSMLGIEKSLLYMSTSLKSCAPTLEIIKGGDFIELFDGDRELMAFVDIEYKQASEMCSIYTDVITKAMDAFSGVVSNNVNASMNFLTGATLLLSIPTAVFSFYGMNTHLLPLSDSWIFPTLLSIALAAIAVVILLPSVLLPLPPVFRYAPRPAGP